MKKKVYSFDSYSDIFTFINKYGIRKTIRAEMCKDNPRLLRDIPKNDTYFNFEEYRLYILNNETIYNLALEYGFEE